MRARLRLLPGAKLYYDCPIRGEDFESDRFFDAHRGKEAEFVGYAEELVAPLDSRGRIPGRYARYDALVVRFAGEEPRSLNAAHFTCFDAAHAALADGKADNRLGDLSHPVLFYPGDRVRFLKKPEERVADELHQIGDVFVGHAQFAPGDVPRYWVAETEAESAARIEATEQKYASRDETNRVMLRIQIIEKSGWNCAAEDLELVSRGNAWALYEDPSKLSFASDEEAAFWAQDGVSRTVTSSKHESAGAMAATFANVFGTDLRSAYELYASGHADLVVVSERFLPRQKEPTYNTRRLHDCFADHRPRVRALTERLWRERAALPTQWAFG